MIEIFDILSRLEFALIVIGVFILIIGFVFGYAMVCEYKMYLEEHQKAHFSFSGFIRQERFYIYLFVASVFIMLTNLLYFL